MTKYIIPEHYQLADGSDPISIGNKVFTKEEMKGFFKMNILKYITRYEKKNGLEDLDKAMDYLKRLYELEVNE